MTIINIKTELVSFFSEKSILRMEDFDKIKLSESLEPYRRNLILQTLKDFEEAKMIKHALSESGDQIWILEMPIGAQGQDVFIPLSLANQISETINSFIDAQEDRDKYTNARCNPLSLRTEDIQSLLGIIDEVISGEDLESQE